MYKLLLPFILISLCFGQGTTLDSGNILSAGERAIYNSQGYLDSMIVSSGDTTWLLHPNGAFNDLQVEYPVISETPSETAFGSSFPDATHCFQNEQHNYWLQSQQSKLFYKLTENEFTLIGVGDPQLGSFRLDNPETIYRFPMQFGDTFSDTSTASSRVVYKTLNVVWDGKLTIKDIDRNSNAILVDSNCLKIKVSYLVIDSLKNYPALGDTVITRTGDYYLWIGSTSKYPYAIGQGTTNGVIYRIYLPESYTQTASPKAAVLNWRVERKKLTLSQQLQKDRRLTIHDLSGRTVYTQNLTAGTAVVRMSYDLSPGIYVLQVEGLGAQKGFVLTE